MSKGRLFITTQPNPLLRTLGCMTLLVCSLSAALPAAQAQDRQTEAVEQVSASSEQPGLPEATDVTATSTEHLGQDTPPLVDPAASEELLPVTLPVVATPSAEVTGDPQATNQQEEDASNFSQPEPWYSAWTHGVELDNESKTVLQWLFVLFILALPFLPFLVLQSLASSDTEVAFANNMEMGAYLIACLFLPIGAALLFNAKGILLLALGVVLVTFSTVLLLSLLGLQRQLSRNLLTTILMFITKISYFVLTFVLAAVFRILALLLFKQSYDDAINREYVRAGLMLGGGAASWRAGGKLMDAMPNYANGERIPAVAAAFPEDSFWDLIALGFEGYGNRYAYQKRWKTQ